MASVFGSIASGSAAPSSSSSSSGAAGAGCKLGSAGVFRKMVSLPLLGPPVVILRHSSCALSKIVCLSNGGSSSSAGWDGFKPVMASFSGYTVTSDNASLPAGNVTSEELAIASLGIDGRIVDALAKRNIVNLFPIQRAVFQPAMQGIDLIARAKTGTGKTLAFGIPILDNISKEKSSMQFRPAGTPRSIILAPTRELAKQVENELVLAAPHLSTVCIYGGVSIEGQRRQLASSVDVVVGTPGRVIDMLERGDLRLHEVKLAILDEADQMLAIGFAEEVERIMEKLPIQRQTMLFSATMPAWIRNITRKYLKDPTMIDLVGENVDKIAEGIKLYSVSTSDLAKNKVLADLITVYAKGGKAIVFTKTKRDTDDVAAIMSRSIGCEALHGDISQYQREKTLGGFRDGRFSVLVATDVAARGLDIPNVDLIVHYEVPNDSETFVHRSGRTGRAGKKGTCILMYTLPQKRILRTIETEVGCKFEAIGPPAAEDVLASSSDHASESIKSVHPDLVKLFLPAAEKLLEEHGVKALAAAMAHVSGVTQLPPKRSLLTHEEGYMTLQMTGENLTDTSAISSAVTHLSSKAGMSMGRISLLSGPTATGGVFDLPEETAKELLSLQNVGNNTLVALKVLPDLQEDYFQSYDRFGRGGRSNFGGGFRSGGSSYGGSYGNRSGSSYGGSSYGGSSYGGSSYSRSGSGYGTSGGSYNSGSGYGRGGGSSYGGTSYNSGTGYNSNSYGAGTPSHNSSGNYGSSSYGGSGNNGSVGRSTDYGGSRTWPSASSSNFGGSSSTGYGANSSTGYGGSSSTGYGANSSTGYGANSSTGYGGSPSTGYGGSSTGYNTGSGNTGSGNTGSGYNSSTGYGGISTGYGSSSGFGASDLGGTSSSYDANPSTPNANTDYGWRKGMSSGATSSAGTGNASGGYGATSGFGNSTPSSAGYGNGSGSSYGYGNSSANAGRSDGYRDNSYGYGSSTGNSAPGGSSFGASTNSGFGGNSGFSSGYGAQNSPSSGYGAQNSPSSAYGAQNSTQAPSYGYGNSHSGYGASSSPASSTGYETSSTNYGSSSGYGGYGASQNSSYGHGAENSTPPPRNDQANSDGTR